jgi:two-component sensor histidine kinase
MSEPQSDEYVNPLTVSMGYVCVSVAWIFLTDRLVINTDIIPLSSSLIHHSKGVLFVLATGFLLYVFMRKYRDRVQSKNEEIKALSQEVHHRVKNNLALITSLLELERENRDFDPEYENLLMHTNFKIKTISVIHELLYQQNAYSKIDLDQFLSEFKERVVTPLTDGDSAEILLKFNNKRSIQVDIQYAIPVALFLYECVVYTIQYKGESIARLFIDLYKTDSNLYLSCHFRADNDVPHIDLGTSDNLELQLAHTLLDQLEAFWRVERDESEAVIYVDISLD